MAPSRQPETPVTLTPDQEEFLRKLGQYHEARGTHFDREPRIAGRHIDLLKLYTRVCEEGGYDAMSDTKAKPLAWRRISGEFLPAGPHLQYQAFMVKTTYYKNLAAYEIKNFHHREPPPKEILEDVSAKGGGILQRTVTNFNRQTATREELSLGNQNQNQAYSLRGERDSSEAGRERTPKEERMDIDDAPSSSGGGRYSRSLRQQPPQRVLFQPDTSSTQQPRHSTSNRRTPPASMGTLNHYDTPTSVPAAMMNGSYVDGMNGNITLANYEPRQQIPSHVKPVTTPANTPDYFRAKRNRPNAFSASTKGVQQKGMMLPGSGFPGPNIYIRALLALQSSMPEEQGYALHHLVKISHERGDKYRFDGFPGLAEALIVKVLEVSSLFYDIRWRISYDSSDDGNDNASSFIGVDSSPSVLNAITGTTNLLQKIASHNLLLHNDDVETQDFSHSLGQINEAGLILRNMILLEENAVYVSKLPLMRDVITIVLSLPNTSPAITEIQHYALEIAEQLTKYYVLDTEDSFYVSLIHYLRNTSDRGAIITTLRALSRISMTLEVKNSLKDIPISLLQQISNWLLVEDEELRNACLDFLYQYTASIYNVEILLQNVNMDALIGQLVRLLTYNAIVDERKERVRPSPKHVPPPAKPPKLSHDIVEQLNQLEEPERSSQWLRTCFEEDPHGEITQIAFWQAYQSTFLDHVAARPLLQAKEFISNVSTTFPGATAQVLNGPVPKYTITGIRPRAAPVDMRGKSYLRCLWRLPTSLSSSSYPNSGSVECDAFALRSSLMWDHVVSEHLNVPRDPTTGKFDLQNAERRVYICEWGGCGRYSDDRTNTKRSPFAVAMHLRTHLPDDGSGGANNGGSSASASHSHSGSVGSISSINGVAGIATKKSRSTNSFTTSQINASTGSNSNNHSNNPKFFLNTQTDERNDAAGLPLASVLVLRNLIRQLPKAETPVPVLQKAGYGSSRDMNSLRHVDENSEVETEDGDVGWVKRLFVPFKEQLYFVMAYNLTLREYIVSITRALAAAGV